VSFQLLQSGLFVKDGDMKSMVADRRNSTSTLSKARADGRDASTKDRILDVAEHLFIDEGFSESSMRRITAKAGASLGAVNYHFGSKEGLLEAVVERQFGPLLMERMSGLKAIGAAPPADGAQITLQLLQSWLDPMLRHLAINPRHVKILYALDQVVAAESKSILSAISPYQNYLIQFGKALQRAKPELSLETVCWRFHFLIGSVSLALSNSDFMLMASDGLCDAADLQTFRKEFLVAAMLMLGIPESEMKRAIRNGSRFPD
jgi:AcrR family transcriptional regulator